jgi:hypothetical protein
MQEANSDNSELSHGPPPGAETPRLGTLTPLKGTSSESTLSGSFPLAHPGVDPLRVVSYGPAPLSG